MKKLLKVFSCVFILVLSMVGYNYTLNIEAAEDDEVIHVIVDNTEMIAEDVYEKFQQDKYDGMVTEVFSINNSVEDCYYRPLLEDVPYLEESVLRRGFINAYTGYFNLDHIESYIPPEFTGRAAEVLGADYLISNESYSGGQYHATRIPSNSVSKAVAVMQLYKALDLPQYEISYYASAVSADELRQSPAVLNLPSFIKGVNPQYGRMRVFVTRSNVELYKDKAKRDMKMSVDRLSDEAITCGEFIVLAADMMDFYGEPRMSDAEMNAVLQVYGDTIPTYLNSAQQEAYLYLRARGVLNEDLNYNSPISLNQMLDILMCIYDEGSRTDFKQIQITVDVNDTLVSKGYFPKKLMLSEGNDAIQIEQEYDYAPADTYDYYVEKIPQTTFTDTSGKEVHTMFIPAVPSSPQAQALSGFEYCGDETLSGKTYIHYRIRIMDLNSNYMTVTKNVMNGEEGWIQINSAVESDKPEYIWLKQGGGIYTYSYGMGTSGAVLSRRAFSDDEFPEAVCAERQTNSQARGESNFFLAVISNIGNAIFGEPMTVRAAGKASVHITIYNAQNISEASMTKLKSFAGVSNFVDRRNEGVVECDLADASKESEFYANIERDLSNPVNMSVTGIANLNSSILLDFDTLAEKGVVYYENPEDKTYPQPIGDNGSILLINTKYGRVILNNELKQIVVGSTVYKISDPSITLFQYGVDSLEIDYRVAYGWSSNLINIEVTGNGATGTYALNVETKEESITHPNYTTSVFIATPENKSKRDEQGLIVNPYYAGNSGEQKLFLTTSNYSLANWVIIQSEDGDYAVVYYLKDAFTSLGMTPPDDSALLSQILGYSVSSNGWAVRIFPLSRTSLSVQQGVLQDVPPGQFMYVEPFGYMYVLPDYSSYSVEAYLNGTYILPLTSNMVSGYSDISENATGKVNNTIINCNINYFTGYPYGSFPKRLASGGAQLSSEYVSIPNLDEYAGSITSATNPGADKIKAAPAGVQSMFGGYQRQYFTNGQAGSFFSSLFYNTNTTSCYYGTMPLTLNKGMTKNNSGTYRTATISAAELGDGNTAWEWEITLDDTVEFYQIAMWKSGKDGKDTNYRYVTFKNIVTQDIAPEASEDMQKKALTVMKESQENEYPDFDKFSLEYLLNRIEEGTSFVILFVFRIFPLIGIILLTIMFGLTTIKDVKIVQYIFQKTIDPVKLLTFGHMTFQEIDQKKAFVGIIIGYCAFAMLMDGNLLRILIWLSAGYSSFSELLRQL